MTREQQAIQLWSVLVLAARNRQILSYETVGELVGYPPHFLSEVLGRVVEYCRANNLPLLTMLVVSTTDGLPKEGVRDPQKLFLEHNRIFAYDWSRRAVPSEEEFREAVQKARAS